MAASSITYTAAERRTVEAGWFALMRAVEISRDQERRVTEAVKARKAGGVTPAGARAFVIETVRSAARQLGSGQVEYLAKQSDEYILCYFVGAWIMQRTESGEYPAEIWDRLADAEQAHRAAVRRALDGIAGR